MGERHLKLDLPTKLIITAVGAGIVLTSLPGSAEQSDASADPTYKAQVVGVDDADAIPDQYIVVLKAPATGEDNAALENAVDRAEDHGADVTQEYGEAINGYAATMNDAELAKVRTDPNVAYIAADTVVTTSDTRSVTSWGQDRIDQRSGLNGKLSTATDGSGVTAYVIDTGVRATHTDLAGRVSSGYTAITDGNGTDDSTCASVSRGTGHGTHVAGTIGGTRYGVAPGVDIVSVRVLGCDGSGTSSGVLAGVNWVTANAVKPAVANLSLGGEANQPLDNAVSASIASGITYGVAAGNDAVDACNVSPARVPQALTVAASTNADVSASFTNYGSCVDLYAPGQAITSDWYTSDTDTNVLSGTSMATPHVVGAAALYLDANPGASPATVASYLLSRATPNAISNTPSGTPNKLLYTGSDIPTTSTPTPTPTTTTAAPTPAPTTTSPSPTPTTTAPTVAPTTQPTTTAPSEPAAPTTPVPSSSTPAASKPSTQTVKTTRGKLSLKTKVVTVTSYTSKRSGRQRGSLTGPRGTNFDLALQKWNGRRWVEVAGGSKAGSTESVSYNGKSGKYRWQVERIKGKGSYALKVTRPI
ncbi:S8 family peptidase [Kineosporia babensis]|uniref:S8 family peptidase n=1 Tax=Kineosporia babensis TaxID=499548 RepID=A0A9X1SYM4_9ACTN|nr:S8 family peptidase [Kineosporia babensis]